MDKPQMTIEEIREEKNALKNEQKQLLEATVVSDSIIESKTKIVDGLVKKKLVESEEKKDKVDISWIDERIKEEPEKTEKKDAVKTDIVDEEIDKSKWASEAFKDFKDKKTPINKNETGDEELSDIEKDKMIDTLFEDKKEKNPEMLEAKGKLEETREKFVNEFKKCKKEADRQTLIDKTRTATFNILAGVKNIFSKNKVEKIKKEIRPEDYFTKETKEAKTEYDKARKEMGEQLFEQKKAELEKAGLSGDELVTALTQYKATEILAKTIIEERQKVIDMKAEGSIKPALWKRLLDGYMRIKPRWKKVALSTLLFLPLSASGALGASAIAAGGIYAGVAGLAAGKFALSMAVGAGVGYLSKGIDLVNKKSDQKFNETQDSKRIELSGKFSNGTIGLEEYEAGIQVIEKEDKEHARNRMLVKFGVGGALAMIGGYVAYDAIGHGMTHIGGSHVDNINNHSDAHTGAKIDNSADHPRPPLRDAINKPFDTTHNLIPKAPEEHLAPGHGVLKPEDIKIVTHASVEVVADHGKGAIATLRDLQHNLKTEYGTDLEHAPASVKHILNTDANKLAQEYGMYKPGADAESAMIKSGSVFHVDGNGNVTYHEAGVPKDITLEKGVEIKVSDTYHGKMFDADHSGVKVEDTTHIQGQGSPDEIINTPHLQSQFEIDHPQVEPVTGETIINTPHYEAPTQIDAEIGKSIPENLERNILTPEELHAVHTTLTDNIKHLFGTDKLMHEWNNIKNVSAEKILELSDKGELKSELQPLVHHIHNLEEITGLHPQGASLINPEPETITHFLNRATEEASKIGRIEEVIL